MCNWPKLNFVNTTLSGGMRALWVFFRSIERGLEAWFERMDLIWWFGGEIVGRYVCRKEGWVRVVVVGAIVANHAMEDLGKE